MRDHLAFCRDLSRLRGELPALRGESLRASTRHPADRVIVIHRWIEGRGQDVVIVANLREESRFGHRVGLPSDGLWRGLFNIDGYDPFPNPDAVGIAGAVAADEFGWDRMRASAAITLRANGFVLFAR
jgi:1,4-alpha-glucan branching enzyme